MTPEAFGSLHADYGGELEAVGGRSVVARYRRPARTHRAIRNGVGVIEAPYDVLRVTGEDRVAALDAAVTNRVPETEGTGCYAFALEAGTIAADLYAYNAGERLLAFVAPGRGPVLADAIAEADTAAVESATGEVAVFGIHGPQATEKLASVLNRTGTPEGQLSFVRGRIADVGVSVVRSDAPAGEPGYEVVCGAEHRETVFDTLLNRGLNAVPFGWETWLALTLEAGTPLYPPDIADRTPAVAGIGAAHPDGAPPGDADERLVGVTLESGDHVTPGATIRDTEGTPIGAVTRTAVSPMLDRRLGFAVVASPNANADRLRVDGPDGTVTGGVTSLPFVDGTEASARRPAARDG